MESKAQIAIALRMKAVVVVGTVSAAVLGCSRTREQEIAALRSEVRASNAAIAELKADVARSSGASRQDGAGTFSGAKARVIVVRGLKPNWLYPIYEGENFIGRADDKPVDIDLEVQEPMDRIWTSRQHACIHCRDGSMTIEDLNSANGTYVNRKRVPPGEKRPLVMEDIIQIGNVQLKVIR